MANLDEYRHSIDEIDNEIKRLFFRRMDVVKSVAEYKRQNNLPVFDSGRESELKEKLYGGVAYDILPYYSDLLNKITELSKDYQTELIGNAGFTDCILENGILKNFDCEFSKYKKALIVTDDGVPTEYVKTVVSVCNSAFIYTIASGEDSKNYETFLNIQKFLIKNEFCRSDVIIAVGGGVVGDIAGFVASTYMRGIDFFNIPTTLLAQVDAAVGGKTAIDFCGYKNIIGCFYNPKKVIIDPDVLVSLDKRQFANGMAEVIKMFATSNKEEFQYLESSDTADIKRIIKSSLSIKTSIVRADFRETGYRRVLNFGHTVGHTVESISQSCANPLLHGESVAIGMLCMASDTAKSRIKPLLNKYNLPTEFSCKKTDFYDTLIHDKKSDESYINTVFLNDIGEFEFRKMSPQEIINYSKGVIKFL